MQASTLLKTLYIPRLKSGIWLIRGKVYVCFGSR